MFAIEKAQREDLLKSGEGDESGLRKRNTKVDRDGLLKMSSGKVFHFINYNIKKYTQ